MDMTPGKETQNVSEAANAGQKKDTHAVTRTPSIIVGIVAAVVVPIDGATIETDALRIRTNAQLSAYKVPTRWLVLSEHEVPSLGSGKPDKRAMRTLLAQA